MRPTIYHMPISIYVYAKAYTCNGMPQTARSDGITAHTVSLYEFSVFFVLLMLFLTGSRWFEVVPDDCSLFQFIAGGLTSLQVVPTGSSFSFQYVYAKTGLVSF